MAPCTKSEIDTMVSLYEIDGLTSYEIADKIKRTPTTVQRNLYKRGVSLRDREISILGRKFGKLIPIVKIDAGHYECECQCGNRKICKKKRLLDGRNTSCGCSMVKRREAHVQYNGFEGITGTRWCAIRQGAKYRKIPFEITIEDAWNQYIKQNRKCAISGIEIEIPVGQHSKKNARLLNLASLDRKDSKIGYIKDNIQWVLREVNLMKIDLTQDLFIDLCKRIAKYND